MKSPTHKLTKAETALRAYALAFPESTEEFPWGERVIKVKGKVFLFLGQPPGGGVGFGVKLPVSAASALAMPFAEPMGYGLGKHGWVGATFPTSNDVPIELLKEWIDESYRAVAPKAVLAKLEAAEEPRPRKNTRTKKKA